jgi:hypothetical protein
MLKEYESILLCSLQSHGTLGLCSVQTLSHHLHHLPPLLVDPTKGPIILPVHYHKVSRHRASLLL